MHALIILPLAALPFLSVARISQEATEKNVRTKILIGTIAAALLISGCKTMPTQSGIKSDIPASSSAEITQEKNLTTATKQSPLYVAARDSGRIASLEDIGLEKMETLWVPARYRSDNSNAWFIRGVRYVSPDGYSNVGGFLETPNGYIAAVIHPSSAVVKQETGIVTPSEEVTVFYHVDKQGNTIDVLGTLPGNDIVVAQDAIWLRNSTDRDLTNVNGFDSTGKRQVGPQGVIFATPSPDGGWYAITSGKRDQDGIEGIIVHTDEAGKSKIIRRTYFNRNSFDRFYNTTAIFVDRPPLADSARTGFVIRLYREHSTISPDFVKWLVAAHHLGKMPPTDTRMTLFGKYTTNLLGDYVESLGSVRRMEQYVAVDLAKRISLANEGDQLQVVTQISKNSLSVGVVEPHRETDTIEKPIFPLLSGTANFIRSVVGDNVGEKSASSKNDVYTIITPKDTVIALAHSAAQHESGYPTYALRADSAISDDEMELFFVQYGINK
jgi:hypothetical protein